VVAHYADGERSHAEEGAKDGAGRAAGGFGELGQDAHLAIGRHPGDLGRFGERDVRGAVRL